MTRTADRAIVGGISMIVGFASTNPELARWCTNLNRMVVDALPVTPIVVADNVADFLVDKQPWLSGGWCLEDLPCVAPPWSSCWIESHRLAPGAKQRTGFWVQGFDLRKAEKVPWFVANAIKDATDVNGFDVDELRFGLMLISYIDDHKDVGGPMGLVALALDERGRIQGNHYAWFGDPTVAQPEMSLIVSATTALQTLAFLHCRNVVTDVVRPAPKHAKAYRKRHGHPPLDYRTVRLQVPRRASESAGGGTGGSRTALHIASGHMAHYGDCCPGVHEPKGLLFGKLEGIYWVPDHLRGDPGYGRTVRDYEPVVKP